MTEQTDEEEFLERCQFYISRIEKLVMAPFPNDTKRVNARQNEIAQDKRSLAKHLGDRSIVYISPSGRQRVTPCWIVSGQPRKRLKSQAREWMAARGLPWTGAPDLREAVQDALEDGDEQVPEGYFGLRVEQTVKFE